MSHDPITSPAHYTVYPVQPIQITRHLGFCLGNATKYVLRAPYKGGVEDCDKALEYLRFENQTPQPPLTHFAWVDTRLPLEKLADFLCKAEGDTLWDDISLLQASFLESLEKYLKLNNQVIEYGGYKALISEMSDHIKELRRVLQLRDTTGQIYEGMTGLPQTPEEEGE